MSTPLRELGVRTEQGWILVSDQESAYADGAEQRVWEILQSAPDVSSTADDLVSRTRTWPELYHLHPARANVLRALALPADATVLEVGAGCGAVTRYLGECCARVDALEPVPARARAARERTRDLTGVEVFVGGVQDVPPHPVYDLVVVVGVLEYVGAGTAERAPYLEFLRRLAAVLKEDGTLVVAIENKLGVKYLAGAPEDHSGRAFDSVEGYPTGTNPARTFARTELLGLLAEAGLPDGRALGAFPDYKLTRAVFEPAALPEHARSLLAVIPSFPSPDWAAPRVAVMDEGRAWSALVEADLAAETANSFVALGTKGGAGPSALWPADSAAVYFSSSRRARFSMRTDVTVVPAPAGNDERVDRRVDVLFVRSPLRLEAAEQARTDGLWVQGGRESFLPGRTLLEEFVDTDDDRSRILLDRWRELVVGLDVSAGLPLDLIARNLVVTEGDALLPFDQEWFAGDQDTTVLLRRGALLLGQHLRDAGRLAGEWAGCRNIRDMVDRIADRLDLEPGSVDRAVAEEVAFQSRIAIFPDAGSATAIHHRVHAELVASLARPLAVEPDLGQRTAAREQELVAAHQEIRDLHVRILSGEQDQLQVRTELLDHRHHLEVARREIDGAAQQIADLGRQLATEVSRSAEQAAAADHARQDAHRFRVAAELSAESVRYLRLAVDADAAERRVRSAAEQALAGEREARIEAEGRLGTGLARAVAAEQQSAALRATVSWRITAPLRAVRRRARSRG